MFLKRSSTHRPHLYFYQVFLTTDVPFFVTLLNMLLILTQVSLSSARCPTDFFGKGCLQHCNCTSPVAKVECACSSTTGLCDRLCMIGKDRVDEASFKPEVLVILLGTIAVVSVSVMMIVLYVHRKKFNLKGPIHRAPGSLRVSLQDAPSLRQLDVTYQNSLIFDVHTDYSTTQAFLNRYVSEHSLIDSSMHDISPCSSQQNINKGKGMGKRQSPVSIATTVTPIFEVECEMDPAAIAELQGHGQSEMKSDTGVSICGRSEDIGQSSVDKVQSTNINSEHFIDSEKQLIETQNTQQTS